MPRTEWGVVLLFTMGPQIEVVVWTRRWLEDGLKDDGRDQRVVKRVA